MILTVRLEIDKNKENYRAVMDALAEFDIASASWEDRHQEPDKRIRSGQSDPGDLSSAVSAAVTQAQNNSQGS